MNKATAINNIKQGRNFQLHDTPRVKINMQYVTSGTYGKSINTIDFNCYRMSIYDVKRQLHIHKNIKMYFAKMFENDIIKAFFELSLLLDKEHGEDWLSNIPEYREDIGIMYENGFFHDIGGMEEFLKGE